MKMKLQSQIKEKDHKDENEITIPNQIGLPDHFVFSPVNTDLH